MFMPITIHRGGLTRVDPPQGWSLDIVDNVPNEGSFA